MSIVWKSISNLVRCDEESVRLNKRLHAWMGGINRVFMNVAEGLPYLQREIDVGCKEITAMHSLISDDTTYMGPQSSRHALVDSILRLLAEHRKNEAELAEFTGFFEVVYQVQSALGSLAELMEDVECFSVNAIVQAHNAGDRGRGFSQVSREVVSLTKRASVEFDQVRSLARDIEQSLGDLEGEVSRSREHFESSPVQREEDVNELFTDLDNTRRESIGQVKKLINGVGESSNCIGQMLVGLQFEDRCSQISVHLEQSLNNFHLQVGELTFGDSDMERAHDNVNGVMDVVGLGAGVFEMVGGLMGSLEEELANSRSDIITALEGFSRNLNAQAENGLDLEGLEQSIRVTQSRLEGVVTYMRDIVTAKGNIVERAQDLAGQIRDLRDDLEGVRRTAKRFGVMASIIKVELASAGLSEEFGEALSADRVENLYRDMASAVGSVLISLDTAVKNVQSRSAAFRRALVLEEDNLREAEAHTRTLVRELDVILVHSLKQGERSLKATLGTLNRETTQLHADLASTVELSQQSKGIKASARSRVQTLEECQRDLLIFNGLASWTVSNEPLRSMLDSCTVQSQRELVSAVLGGGTVEVGAAGGEVELF